jgi:hypothetical protein
VLGWPQVCQLAHVFRWECSYKGLKLAQLLGQLGFFLTRAAPTCPCYPSPVPGVSVRASRWARRLQLTIMVVGGLVLWVGFGGSYGWFESGGGGTG